MRIKFLPTAILIVLVSIIACNREPTVNLSVDFSSQPMWRYNAKVLVSGSMTTLDTSTNYSGMANLVLLGKSYKKAPAKLQLTIPSVRISTDFMDDAEKENLKKQLEQLQLDISMDEGTVDLSDTADLPTLITGSWGLDKSLAKVLPVLPDIPVTRGSKWERNKQTSIRTSHGDAVAHLFQAFIVDSIYHKNQKTMASISWDLSYKIELENPDTTGLLVQLPDGGEGSGHAVINTTDNSVDFARIEFAVKSKENRGIRIGWKEIVELSLAQRKQETS
ncbi:MAG: hypothetical protein GF401_11125 [Chitinivibrionales bacterium]|nr:hypothetical protein [Chitinivibrionales bacterium]